ncbi:ATP-binding cassette domain-containing protein [Azospirillum melinis]|uniref:ATP-binding cassette domain-containing protein n=1 Tax=Azospirillum melinis TaxID=328839 RepID=A0ABX2KF18_9PROT|nr:ABC transporter ATP-binding protein [Azospirillum melinis]MBP2307013.1 spermidine/putrescine transport system ATP-binding protein [Azospirillum melinis]NUB02190.1 ATP-binding cassette domain-containing protein [Azospirillum melinis]
MPPALLSIRDLGKRFGGFHALKGVSLEVEHGEFIALLGPSGCGKTTLLRCIAGFLTPDSGDIRIGGDSVTRLPPHRRPLNTVFQNYALFPHMSVLDNIAYGPRRHGVPRGEAAERAAQALQLVGLEALGARYPRELSGGQQQRVALARAVVNRPKLLLLDEPLSALDMKLRKRMQIELKHLQEKLGIAFVFVTHDQEEAMSMADRIVVMNRGLIEQVGSGTAVYATPATRFVAEFIGEANFLPGAADGDGGLRLAFGTAAVPYSGPHPAPGPGTGAGGSRTGVLRPEHLELLDRADAPGFLTERGIVEDVINTGGQTLVMVRVGDALLASRRLGMPGAGLGRGTQVVVGFRPEHLHVVAGEPVP